METRPSTEALPSKIVDEVGLLPGSDGEAPPTRRVDDGVTERRNGLFAKELVLVGVGLELAA